MDLAFMGIALQLARVKIMLVSDLMPLSLGLEELFTVHDGSTRRASGRAAATVRGKRDTHTMGVHLCSGIEPCHTLCLRAKVLCELHSGSSEQHGISVLGTQTHVLEGWAFALEILKPPGILPYFYQ
jgi:hypothetical protein